jgi:biotin carboxylase
VRPCEVVDFTESSIDHALLIVWGRTGGEATARGARALRELRIGGVMTTVPFHLSLLEDHQFLAGDHDTGYLGELAR